MKVLLRLRSLHLDIGQSVCQRQNLFQRFCQALLDSRLHNQPVNQDLDVMLDILVQLHLLAEFIQIPVDPYTDIAGAPCMFKKLGMLPLPASHDRCKQLDPASLRKLHDSVRHLIDGLLFDLPAACGAVHRSAAGIEQTKIIINLRHRPDCRARIVVCGLLVDGDCRREALDAVHLRLLHLAEELACIAGERLHIPPLSFCIDGVKGQGALS